LEEVVRVSAQCSAQIADPDKPGRLYQCDRGPHGGQHHTVNDRSESIAWGTVDKTGNTPRPAESMVAAYTEHARAMRAYQAAPDDATAARVRAAQEVVTREEAGYVADCIAAGVAPYQRPLDLDGLR
jgi:hypothetical protein